MLAEFLILSTIWLEDADLTQQDAAIAEPAATATEDHLPLIDLLPLLSSLEPTDAENNDGPRLEGRVEVMVKPLAERQNAEGEEPPAALPPEEEPPGELPATEADDAFPPSKAERLAELEELFDQLVGLSPATFDGNESRPVAAVKLGTTDPTILSIQASTKIASKHVRVMDVVTFVEDPESIESFVGSIILCPSPDVDEYLTLTRDQILKRLKQYNVSLDRLILTGSNQVLVLRTKAQAPDEDDSENEDNGDEAVSKGASILIVREGELFRIEEWGTAKQGGSIGEVITIIDRKDRTFQATITGPNTVTPLEQEK